MRINDLTTATALNNADKLVIDGSLGTRAITYEQFCNLTKKKINFQYDIWGPNGEIPWQMRNMIYRGKNLGSVVTQSKRSAIASGKFYCPDGTDLFLGDYWLIDDIKWVIVDFNYYMKGPANTNHVVIMPNKAITQSAMNDAATTAGGYVGSKLRTSIIPDIVKPVIESVFGADYILKRKSFLTNSYPIASAWVDADVDIPNEVMMTGCRFYSNDQATFDCTQLSLFVLAPYTSLNNVNMWLRDIHNSDRFCIYDKYTVPVQALANSIQGVWPVFGLTGEPQPLVNNNPVL